MNSWTRFRIDRLTHLGNLPVADFLQDYWQQKPLLIKAAIKDFRSLITADEIAGLALEDGVTSRLVREDRTSGKWTLEHGPLVDDVFNRLPDDHWTLLIQYADSLDPRLSGLLNAFRFIPNWRLDDLMVSYATDGGGVGPHFDYFDVFLLQAEGTRRWQIGQTCHATTALVADSPMKILQHFDAQQEWLAEPGDLLYIPARLAHWGTAIGECITYSIGFRAPSHGPLAHQGEISDDVIRQFQGILQRYTSDPKAIARWLGQYSTQLKQPIDELYDTIDLARLKNDSPCQLSPQCRAAFHTQGEQTLCFINGVSWPCSERLAILLSDYARFTYAQIDQHDRALLMQLAQDGLLIACEPDNAFSSNAL